MKPPSPRSRTGSSCCRCASGSRTTSGCSRPWRAASTPPGWGPGRTHLALTTTYEPPFGVVGRAVDRVLLHRVAEAVAQRFLEAVAGLLGTMGRAAVSPAREGTDGR